MSSLREDFRGGFLPDSLVQLRIGQPTLEPDIVFVSCLKQLGLVGAQASVLLAPAASARPLSIGPAAHFEDTASSVC